MAFNHIRRACKPNDHRFTLSTTVEQIKKLVGVTEFDLDVAAELAAHVAPVWFGPGGAAEDGMDTPWLGHVFCNPPWSQKGLWVAKGWQEMHESRVLSIAMLLPATTDQAWWHEYVEPRRGKKFLSVVNQPYTFDVHFLPGRTQYGTPEDPLASKNSSPPFGSCVLVWKTV